ncbi:MAG TPA: phosphatase PAP2 family protein [Candidatus Paceibacterota bacterium]
MVFWTFFHQAASLFLRAFTWPYILWHILAALLTLLLVMSGFDWWFYLETRSPIYYSLTLAAGIGGFFVPVLVPLLMLVYGNVQRSPTTVKRALILAQAVIVSWLISSTYKAFTGRVEPEFLTFTSSLDNSRDFNFGFWEYGIFWGWPSSHTAVACALAAALFVLYKHSAMTRAAAVFYAFFIALGAGIGFHWFSDVLAGVIVGTLVGFLAARQKL